jgi:hypothetical protein
MNPRELCIPSNLYEQLTPMLFTGDQGENFCFGLARPLRRRSNLLYMLERVVGSTSNDYEGRSAGGLTMTRAASNKFNAIARDAAGAGLVPVHFHSHPPGCNHFSAYDDAHERELHAWLRSVQQPLLLSVVLPYKGRPAARLWVQGDAEALPVRRGLQPIGGYSRYDHGALDRQRAFGPSLAAAAASLTVAIVGVGGIGMLVVEQLARCGFRSFVLVDPDTVEITNLNRLNATNRGDLGQRKVVVAARLIHSCADALGIAADVMVFAEDIYTAPRRVQEMVRQSDLILALTDDQASRLHTLMLAMDAGAEFLSAGVDVRLSNSGEIEGLYAEVVGGERNRFCPVCAGRLDPSEAAIETRRYVGGIVTEHARRAGYLSDVPAPSVMSLNSTAAGMLVLEIQRRVSGLGRRDLVQLDWQTGRIRAIDDGHMFLRDGCAVCGRPRTAEQQNS